MLFKIERWFDSHPFLACITVAIVMVGLALCMP